MVTEPTASRRLNPVRSWSDLPDRPLYTILACLCSYVDFVSFSSVCRSWRAVASSLSMSRITSLFLPFLCATFTRHHHSYFLRLLAPASPSLKSSISCRFSKFVSVDYGFVSSHGRLLRLSDNRIIILNPFTSDQLYSSITPHANPSPFFFPLQSSTVSFTGFELLLFTSRTLFHWHIDAPTWSCHSPRIKPKSIRPVIVAIVKGKIYAKDCAETLFVVDLSPQLHLRKLAIDGIAEDNYNYQQFLVDCGGELLLLHLVETEQEFGMQLEAFQLDVSANRAVWVKKEALGNWAIFVGYDRRLLGLAVENTERWGGRSNYVYFATGNGYGDWPWAVEKLGDEDNSTATESPLFNGEFSGNSLAVWVYPGF